MIVGSTKVSTSKSSFMNMVNHVSNADDNESVEIFDTHEQHITRQQLKHLTQHFLEAADANKDKYCMMQFMFNSKESMTTQQLFNFKNKICEEFGIDDANNDVYLMQHQKQLKGGGYEYHAHFLTNYRGYEHGKVIDTSFSKMREEKLARVFELELGHQPTQGKFNKQVLKQLEKEGYPRLEEMKARLITDKEQLKRERPSRPHYSRSTLQQAKKQGNVDLFKDLQQQAHDIFKNCRTGVELQEALKKEGFTLKKGDKAAFVLEKDGITLGSAGKTFGVKNTLLRDILEGKKEILNKTEKTEGKREAANEKIKREEKKQEKQDIYKSLGFTDVQAKELTRLNRRIERLEKKIQEFEDKKINVDDHELMSRYARGDLKKQGKRVNANRVKAHIPKMKEKAEGKNDIIQSKINEMKKDQRESLVKFEAICQSNIDKHAKTPNAAANSKFSKGNKARPQNLRQMINELGNSEKSRAASRFSNREHEYTKDPDAAPTYEVKR